MNHAFDTEIAKDVGIISAVLFNHIAFWCASNRENGVNEIDGEFWTFHSIKDLQDTFDYLTYDQIRRGITRLEKKGYIKIGAFNKLNIDRTRWFCVAKPELAKMPHGVANMPIGVANLPNAFGKNHTPIPYKSIIPNNTNNISNKKETKKESSFDSIFDSYSVIKDNPALKETFVEFVKMRKANKKPLTDKALKLNINKAVDLGNGDPETIQKVVEQTIANGWQGMFPLKNNGNQPKKQTVTNEFERMLNGEEVESFNEFEELLRKETRT